MSPCSWVVVYDILVTNITKELQLGNWLEFVNREKHENENLMYNAETEIEREEAKENYFYYDGKYDAIVRMLES